MYESLSSIESILHARSHLSFIPCGNDRIIRGKLEIYSFIGKASKEHLVRRNRQESEEVSN